MSEWQIGATHTRGDSTTGESRGARQSHEFREASGASQPVCLARSYGGGVMSQCAACSVAPGVNGIAKPSEFGSRNHIYSNVTVKIVELLKAEHS